MRNHFRILASELERELKSLERLNVELTPLLPAPQSPEPASEIPGVRTAAISQALAEELDDFLRFRHLFRNVYGFQLRWAKFSALAKKMGPILQRFREEIEAFLKFLCALEKGMANKE